MPHRHCRCCTKCVWRSFDSVDANCPEHGANNTYTDLNRPYRGEAIAQAPGFDKAKYEKGAKERGSRVMERS